MFSKRVLLLVGVSFMGGGGGGGGKRGLGGVLHQNFLKGRFY